MINKMFISILILFISCSIMGCVENKNELDESSDELYIINIEHNIINNKDYIDIRFIEDGYIKNTNEKYITLKPSFDDEYHLYPKKNVFLNRNLYISIHNR